jgi:Asp-tRNA(Asn)/Glu-tRNA(Gln) amidotransferase A subunit family amidase
VLGERMTDVELPEHFAQAHAWHRAINYADLAHNYGRYYDADKSLLSDRLRGMIEEGQAVTAVSYSRAIEGMALLNAGLEKLFERFDAIVTPAAPGEAPVGLGATGDPVFNTLWTYCGAPALALPLLTGPNNMPVGVQLVGRRNHDGRLLRSARWLKEMLREEGQDVAAVMGASA